jgi:RHS repeat-associated protein
VSLPGQGAITMSDFRWTRPQTTTYPGGAIRSEQYDAIQRTRQITVHAGSETRMDWRYTYDATGNITRIDTEHGRYAFAYDALDRLIEADYPNGPQHDQINASFAPNTFPFADDRYSYDPIGNRLSSQSQPGPWAYNGNSELIQSPFGTTTFNLAGSTTEERTPTEQLIRRFAYDTEERPTEVTNAQGQRIARYYHDPFGRRLWKTLEPGAEGHSGAPGPETIYLAYNDEGYAAEFRLPGTPDTAPTQGPSSYSTLWVHEPDGLWSTGAIAIRIDGNWRYPQHDHLATPRMVIDGQGAVTTTLRMNAFGETRHQGEAIANRFPGQVFDVETGLHYNYFRSYQPPTGRYTQADPIGIRGGLAISMYVESAPTTSIDPVGLFPACWAVVVWRGPIRSEVSNLQVGDPEWELRNATEQFRQGRPVRGRLPLPGGLMANCFAVLIQKYIEITERSLVKHVLELCIERDCDGWRQFMHYRQEVEILEPLRKRAQKVVDKKTAFIPIKARGDARFYCAEWVKGL